MLEGYVEINYLKCWAIWDDSPNTFTMIPVREIRYNSFAQMIVKNQKPSKVPPPTRPRL
jgi:hypothetical protein